MQEEWKSFSNIKVSNYGRVETRKGIHEGYNHRQGYKFVNVVYNGEKKLMTIHRIVAHLFLGLDLADKQAKVNHIDNVPSNNNVTNLEIVTQRQNLQRKKCHNEGKLVGAHYYKKTGKWHSSIQYNKKSIHLGVFLTELEAHQKYMEVLHELLESSKEIKR